jgi:cytochrome c oxidase assembly protein subunit 15
MVSASATRAAGRAGEEGHRAVAAWLFVCCAMIFLMVVIGGLTRLTLSGLSITEWEPVTGIVPPLSGSDWAAEFAKYQAIPQYKLINAGMSLAQFKTIFWWEYAHRLWGRLIGFVYLLPFLYFIARRQIPRRLVAPLAGIFALGAAQGALGWYMVESGLANRIEVSQYRLTAHLALALAIYAATLWAALGLLTTNSSPPIGGRGRGPSQSDGKVRCASTAGAYPPHPGPLPPMGGEGATISPHWRRAAEAILCLVAITIVAGGFTAGLNAGLVYNTFPLMGGTFVPGEYAELTPFVRNWFENVAAVQFDHRVLAMTTAASIVALWLAASRTALPRPARIALHALLAAVALQFSLGLSTLLLVVPTPLAAAHQAGAVLLLTGAIVFRHKLRAR